jgi:hypothetical protein
MPLVPPMLIWMPGNPVASQEEAGWSPAGCWELISLQGSRTEG